MFDLSSRPLFKNTCGPDLDLAQLWARSTPQMHAPGRHLRTSPAFYAIQWHVPSADYFDYGEFGQEFGGGEG